MIFITGAAGFIGSRLCEYLVRNGNKIRALCQYNSLGHREWFDYMDSEIIENIDIVMGDVRDRTCVREAMRGCHQCIHLASLIAIPYSYRAPESYIDTNVKGTLNVLEAARDLGIERLIHTSTSEVYGTAQYVPIDEKHPLQGQSPYSASKIAADQLAYSYYASFGLPVVTIRPFNTYGPRQSARAVIPTIITQLLTGGDKLKLGAIHPTRDFNYVEDTAAGFAKALEANLDDIAGQVINLGSSFEVSIGEAAQIIVDILGVKTDIMTDKERIRPAKSEVERLWADNRKAHELLGWTPSFGGREGLLRGLKKTVEWFSESENLKLYHPGIYNV